MEHQEYADLDVLLEKSGDGFTARVITSPVGPSQPVDFLPPLEADLVALVDEMRRIRGRVDAQTGRRVVPQGLSGSPTAPGAPTSGPPMTPKEYGTRLFDALFVGSTLDVLRFGLRALDHQQGLRLRLRFGEGAAELAGLPWEFLYDRGRHIFPCQFRDSPTVRVVELPNEVRPFAIDGPLRMLVVISSPTDLPRLDVEREWALLEEAVQPLVDARRLEVVRLASSELNAVWTATSSNEFHIFHFIGHGGTDRDSGEGHLAFRQADGRARLVGAASLRVVLSNSRFRLAVLNACEGGRATAADPYASTAVSLVEQGIPAVVAMQFEISDLAAIEFSRELYGRLTTGRSIEESMALARQAILIHSEREWATPVLYLRDRGGELFARPEGRPDGIGQEAPPRLEPAAPVGLSASEQGEQVTLHWDQPVVAGVTVDRWAVVRDGEPHATVDEPRFLDSSVVPGRHTYVVVAGSSAGEMSEPSEPCVVAVPTAPPPPPPPPNPIARWVAAGVVATVLALLVWVFMSGPDAVAAPTNVRVASASLPVTLVWDPAPRDSGVTQWEVFRDGVAVETVPTPTWQDLEATALGQKYEVRAVAASGEVSALAVAQLMYTTTTTTNTTTTTTTTTTTSPVVLVADVRVVRKEAHHVEGRTWAATFTVTNRGPRTAEGVRVEVTGPAIREASLSGHACTVAATTSCAAIDLKNGRFATLAVQFSYREGDPELGVSVRSKTKDPMSANNTSGFTPDLIARVDVNADGNGTLESPAERALTIRVTNTGSKDLTDVRLVVQFSGDGGLNGMTVAWAGGPDTPCPLATDHLFAECPTGSLEPGALATLSLRASFKSLDSKVVVTAASAVDGIEDSATWPRQGVVTPGQELESQPPVIG